jgi:hypothetical protein
LDTACDLEMTRVRSSAPEWTAHHARFHAIALATFVASGDVRHEPGAFG